MTPTPTVLELHAGALRLSMRPDLGAAIAGLWRADVPVLASVDDPLALSAADESGGFVLAPYGHRLGLRRFRWLGRDYTTLPNVEGSAHSLHGVAWRRPWTVVQSDAARATLEYRHAADGHWPFDFVVSQQLQLTPEALRIDLVITNTGSVPQPAGLGWHPWFVKRARSRLHVELGERWENDPGTRLPTRRVPQPGLDGDVAHMAFDHCFEGWHGAARIRDERMSLRLLSSLPYLVVCTPEASERFSVAPHSHVSNAIHMADPLTHGLRALQQGQSLDGWVTLEIQGV